MESGAHVRSSPRRGERTPSGGSTFIARRILCENPERGPSPPRGRGLGEGARPFLLRHFHPWWRTEFMKTPVTIRFCEVSCTNENTVMFEHKTRHITLKSQNAKHGMTRLIPHSAARTPNSNCDLCALTRSSTRGRRSLQGSEFPLQRAQGLNPHFPQEPSLDPWISAGVILCNNPARSVGQLRRKSSRSLAVSSAFKRLLAAKKIFLGSRITTSGTCPDLGWVLEKVKRLVDGMGIGR